VIVTLGVITLPFSTTVRESGKAKSKKNQWNQFDALRWPAVVVSCHWVKTVS